jgi:4-amino-4-deoxy-L-arabinose transferase-like glycosyltransferase
MVKKIILILLIVLGIFLRVYQFNSLPGGLFMDEINIAVDAKTLAENGTDQYGNHLPFTFEDVTDFKLPVYIYLSAIMYKIFGPHVFTVRIVALLASISTIFSLGYLTKVLFKKRPYLPLITMAIIAISPFAIHFARIAYETTLATFFISIFLISLVKVFREERKLLWFILGSVSAILSTYTYPGPRFIIPVFTFILFLVSFFVSFEGKPKKQTCMALFGFLIVAGLSFIPNFIFASTANDRSLRLSYLLEDTSGTGPLSIITSKISSVVSSWIYLFNLEFLFDKGDIFAYRSGTKEIGIFLSIFIIPYITGIFYYIKTFRLKNFPLLFLGLFALVAGLPSALTSGVPYASRMIQMLIPLCILIGLGIEQILEFLSKRDKKLQAMIYLIVGIVLLYQIGLFSYIYFVHFKSTSQPEFPQASVEVSKYIKAEMIKNPSKPIYFLNNTTCGLWTFDALVLWYFADLPNNQMIKWNNSYRTARYNTKNMSPFDAYWNITIPTDKVKNITLFPGYKATTGPATFVRCGFHLPTMDLKKEKIDEIFYLHEDIKTDPMYVVSETK